MSAAKRRRPERDTLPTQRIAAVTYILTVNAGSKVTTADLARRVGMQVKDVWDMLDKISASHDVPLTRDIDGWMILGPEDVPY